MGGYPLNPIQTTLNRRPLRSLTLLAIQNGERTERSCSDFIDPYGCIVYGSARKSYLQMLDHTHNQGPRLRLEQLGHRLESSYVGAHETSLGARLAKFLFSILPRLSLYRNMLHITRCMVTQL